MTIASQTIRNRCLSLIASKKSTLSSTGLPQSKDILSVALSSGAFTDRDLVEQVMTFLIAGHETTAAALAWAIYRLCLHPRYQAQLRHEVRANSIHNDDGSVNVALDNCVLLQGFCTEILRLYPPIPLTLRMAARDTSIQNHFIPKDTVIILSPWAVNTSTELWGRDAQEFKPERWLHEPKVITSEISNEIENGGKGGEGVNTAYRFLTFLHGPRSCIGQRFAMAEFAALVAAWVGTFETELAMDKGEEVIVKNGISARPGGLKVHLKKTGLDA